MSISSRFLVVKPNLTGEWQKKYIYKLIMAGQIETKYEKSKRSEHRITNRRNDRRRMDRKKTDTTRFWRVFGPEALDKITRAEYVRVHWKKVWEVKKL